ncbi:MAG: hypothetical protein IJ524_06610 [Bacteroidales bacterium]|nr:hypothetical protein [Bacteroidales bacterium]
MRRSQIISIAIVLVAIVLAVVFHRPRMLPVSQCSDIYRQYYKTDGIQATFIKDYDLGDSVTVDVTILQATDSTAWNRLLGDFHVMVDSVAIAMKQRSADETWMTTTSLFPKGHVGAPPDTVLTNNDFLMVYYPRKSLYVFDIRQEKQFYTILSYKYKKYKNQ